MDINSNKQKMQNVNFKSIDEFLEFLPEDELKIVEIFRDIVFNNIPDVVEKLAFNVPFYKRNSNICFIWPASVLWGKKKTYDGVRFGFSNGYLLNDPDGFLDKGNRKNVYWKDFKSINEIDISLIKSLLFDAIIIDSELANRNKIKKNYYY
jgi:hypothetical protein